MSSEIGLVGLAVMGQNLALNIAEKGFPISVYNRSYEKVVATEQRAKEENISGLTGYKDLKDFIQSIRKPRAVIMLIQAGRPVDETIEKLSELLEEGDLIIDGGNEWFLNTERRAAALEKKGILYMGMGVSGGEDGARHGPALMPGGPHQAYERVEPILRKIAAQVKEEGKDSPCVTYIGPRGSGNYVKMIHNGIEYGDMQLIAEAYDLLKNLGGLTNEELHQTFSEWNQGELQSFLIEITAKIFGKKDEDGKEYIVDKILDKTGMKGTGRMTVQEAAERLVPSPTITAALDTRYLSGLLEERKAASAVLTGPSEADIELVKKQIEQNGGKKQLIDDIRKALYAAKICSYAQGMNIIKEASKTFGWNLQLGDIARIWKGGCIIRAIFLDRIKNAYVQNPDLSNLLMDPSFAKEMNERQSALRRVVSLAISAGVTAPAFSASLWYYDTYRRARLPANLTQAQRDFFGAHTYERTDKPGHFHTEWSK